MLDNVICNDAVSDFNVLVDMESWLQCWIWLIWEHLQKCNYTKIFIRDSERKWMLVINEIEEMKDVILIHARYVFACV